ncbi:MAG: hypothetical protein SGBAC_005841 [Bacillariaceae sp.]
MSTVTTMPTTAPEQAPFSPIFRRVETETDAPLFRNKQAYKKKKSKRFSLKKMMSKVKSSKRILKISKSFSSHDSSDDASVDPTKKLDFEKESSSEQAPQLAMVMSTDDELSYASSDVGQQQEDVAVHEEAHKQTTVSETIESSSTIAEPSLEETESEATSEVKQVKKTINYEIDDEEYVEEKELEKTPCTPSDAMALLLAGLLIAAQALA